MQAHGLDWVLGMSLHDTRHEAVCLCAEPKLKGWPHNVEAGWRIILICV